MFNFGHKQKFIFWNVKACRFYRKDFEQSNSKYWEMSLVTKIKNSAK